MIPKEYRAPIFTMILAGILWMTSLYQIEIVFIWQGIGKEVFEMPFYLWTMSLPMARDFWYFINALSLALAVYSGATFNGKRVERMMKNGRTTEITNE